MTTHETSATAMIVTIAATNRKARKAATCVTRNDVGWRATTTPDPSGRSQREAAARNSRSPFGRMVAMDVPVSAASTRTAAGTRGGTPSIRPDA